MNLLLVEDNKIIQKIVKRDLESGGHAVQVAENGKQALEKVSEGGLELVFMDIHMPDFDGYEVTREIRKAGNSDLPIVAFSATIDNEVLFCCDEAGMNGCLLKPAKRDELLRAVKHYAKTYSSNSKAAGTAVKPGSAGLSQADTAKQAAEPDWVDQLVANIHNPDPVVRKAVAAHLVQIGEESLPKISEKLDSTSDDEVIAAANILGEIGHRSTEDALFRLTSHINPNVRFAAYEALGKMPTLKSRFSLLEGLRDSDYSVVCSVVTAMAKETLPPSFLDSVEACLEDEGRQEMIVSAIVDMRATELFVALQERRAILKHIVDKAVERGDHQTIDAFFDASIQIANKVTRKGCLAVLAGTLEQDRKAVAKVLAVDDSKIMRDIYQSMLSELGYIVDTAENGRLMVEMLKTETYDLIILDMNMPEMNGIEAAIHVRRQMQSEVPIIMVSTESQASQKERAKRAGVNEFLAKPFSVGSLHSLIKSQIKKARHQER